MFFSRGGLAANVGNNPPRAAPDRPANRRKQEGDEVLFAKIANRSA